MGGLAVDTFNGGDGDDTVAGGAGADIMNGGAGNDTLEYSAIVDPNIAHHGHARCRRPSGDMVKSGTDPVGDKVVNFENVTGGAGNHIITGNASDNVLQGGDGIDVFVASLGVDTVIGGAGINTLRFSAFSAAVELDLQQGLAQSPLLPAQ